MKELQINDELKPKSVIVDGVLHNQFKDYCRRKCMKIGGVVEDLMKLYLNNPSEMQKLIDTNNDKHTTRH